MRAYVSLGANVGRPALQLLEAIGRLTAAGLGAVAVSGAYETEPQGGPPQPWYTNCAVALETDLPPEALLRELQAVEDAMGRRRGVRWGPRVIDLDLLLYGDEVRNTAELTLPHPRLHERAFALVPLAELAPGIAVPGHGPVERLARALAGQQIVRPLGPLPGYTARPLGTRGRLLGLLEAAAGAGVSGEHLAGDLGVSRAAVWKHAERLRQEGFPVEGSRGQGYRLPADEATAPMPTGALGRLDVRRVGRILHVLPRVDSTNRLARDLGLQGAPEGTAILASEQTAGRGRRGRTFASPTGGVYLSCILRPPLPPAQATRCTLLAALAVCEALEGLGLAPAIKWPNDVLLPGGKVAGILLEMVAREDQVDFLVLGMGINVSRAPGGVGAASVWDGGARAPRAVVAKALLERLDSAYGRLADGHWAELLEGWRRRSTTLGARVRVDLADGPPLEGVAKDVQEDGALLVDSGGMTRVVYAGDVTHLRPA